MRDALDACLTRTFRDVAVPEGLAERLLAGLAVDSPDGGADLPVCRTHRSLSGRQECLPHYRRWLLLAGGLAAAAAAIILAVWLGGRGGESISEESARNEAIRLFDADAGQPGSALPAANATTDYPISSYVRSFPAQRGDTCAISLAVLASFTTCRCSPAPRRIVRGCLRQCGRARPIAGQGRLQVGQFPLLRIGMARERPALRPRGRGRAVELPTVSEPAVQPGGLKTKHRRRPGR